MDEPAPEPFAPGTLAAAVSAVTERALASGALQSIPTGSTWVEEGGVRFLVRVLTNLARKDDERWRREQEAAAGKPPVNPFLPYDPALFVAGVSASHVAILNKFNVVERHVLVVTRRFEDQRALLTPADFEALWRCLVEYPSLGFYNGGAEAGASQPHKHLQLVSLPLADEGPPVPIDPIIARVAPAAVGVATSLPGFDFLNGFARLPVGAARGADSAGEARAAWETYRGLLAHVGLRAPAGGDVPEMQSAPYCLLATRDWVLLVPRSREHFGSVSINSLGYAGALLVRNEEELEMLRKVGPFAALRETALPSPER